MVYIPSQIAQLADAMRARAQTSYATARIKNQATQCPNWAARIP